MFAVALRNTLPDQQKTASAEKWTLGLREAGGA
jgi:hypothetical protein